MAKLSTPEEMDEIEESDGSNDNPVVPQDLEPKIPEVDFVGEGEIPITDAVESLSKITQYPEAFNVASTEQIIDLQNENLKLRKELAELREDVAVLWEALSTELQGQQAVQVSEGSAYAPEAFDGENPVNSARERGPDA